MTEVKICGITRPEDARLAVDLGAWAIGLILHADSPRRCEPAVAEQIGAELKRQTEVVGVFVNATLDEVADAADRCDLGILQLHGDEGPAYCSEIARRTGCKVMKVARVRDASSIRALGAYRTDLRMLDAYRADSYGGTGQTFDWDLIYKRGPVPLVLSGGLGPDNAGEAIARVHPYALDTASGTESAPGIKDPALVKAFFRAVDQADSVTRRARLGIPEEEVEVALEGPAAVSEEPA